MRPLDHWTRRCAACGYMAAGLTPGFGRGVDGLAPVQRVNDKATLDEIRRHLGSGGKSLLDVGCGGGGFVERAAVAGFRAEGIEPAPDAERTANGLPIRPEAFPIKPVDGAAYDAITFNHSFEHLPCPAKAAAASSGLLRQGGVVALQLPSSQGTLFKLASFGRRAGLFAAWELLWQKGLPSPHLHYFNPGNLRRLFERTTDLRLISTQRLQAVRIPGLWRRIRCRLSAPSALVAFTMLALAVPLLNRLPPDFILCVFRKPAPPRQPAR